MTDSVVNVPQKNRFFQSLLRLRVLLISGIAAHLVATILVFFAGASMSFPNWIGPQGTLREDSTRYLNEIEIRSAEFSSGNFQSLITVPDQVHLRVYSLVHFLASGFTGSNILAFEIINLPLFLLILLLVYKIAELLFDEKIGILAGFSVVCLPSFVLHTTQPLRDGLFTAVFLCLFVQLLFLLKAKIRPLNAAILSFLGILNFLILWFIRDSMWPVYLGVLATAIFLLLFQNLNNKWESRFNLIPIIMIFLVAGIAPALLGDYLPSKRDAEPGISMEVERFAKAQRELGYPEYLVKVNSIRFGFSKSYRDAGSNIDADYLFGNTIALIRYVPKAFTIGLFAPFPNSWLGTGVEYGKTGRLVAGAETCVMYLVIFLAFCGALRNRILPVALVFLSVLIGTTALGLVVINVGAIYRLRYIFWMLLIILGVKGAIELWNFRSAISTPAESKR